MDRGFTPKKPNFSISSLLIKRTVFGFVKYWLPLADDLRTKLYESVLMFSKEFAGLKQF